MYEIKTRENTIYDVAKQAGVSASTVSRVLNSPTQVNTATRARVMAVIEDLGFVPLAEAAARARKGTARIGVLAPFFTYSSFVQRLRGVSDALVSSNYELVIYNIDTALRRDSYFASLPLTRRLDGLIIMSLPCDAEAIHQLVAHGIEVVSIEYAHSGTSSVLIDNAEGGRMVGAYFAAQGHRRCAFVGDSDVPDYALHTSDQRLSGYREALAGAGINLLDEYVSLAPHGMEFARQQALHLFDLPEPPTAIFAPSDTQAIGVMKAIHDRGLRVPNDIAVIGFDDIDVAAYINLTTVRQPLEESGQIAVELLLNRLADRSRSARRVQLPLTLVQRETA